VAAERTRRRYIVHVHRFLERMKARGIAFPRTVEQLDRRLEEALAEMWWDGDPKGWAADLLSGVQRFSPNCRKRLTGAWRLFGAWSRKEAPSRAPPMDRKVVMGVAARFWKRGHPYAALVVLLAHHCYVRTGELLKLTRKGLFVGEDGRGIVSLSETKGRRIEMVSFDDHRLGLILRVFMSGLLPGERLVRMSAVEFRRVFREVCAELGLGRMEYKPYSLRRGGATEDFRRHGSLDRAMLRGRWKSVAAARAYILEGWRATRGFSGQRRRSRPCRRRVHG